MSNFISDLRNKVNNANTMPSVKDTRSASDVLSKYSSFNMNDVLNDIFIIDELREAGDETGARIAYESFVNHGVVFSSDDSSVDAFFSYLITKSDIDKSLDVDESLKRNGRNASIGFNSGQKIKLTDNEKLVSAIIIKESSSEFRAESITFTSLCKFLDISHGREAVLSNSEFAELSNMSDVSDTNVYRNIARQIVMSHPIPEVKHISDIHETADLPLLYDKYSNDDFFCRHYKIKNVFAVKHNAQSRNAHKQGSKHLTLNTGTGNESLIKILNGGFKRPSELRKDKKSGANMAGQAFGDAVYFAKPEEISKNTAYLDKSNPGSKFIIVADVYYDKRRHVKDYNSSLKYNGRNLVHAHSIGAYDRDEFMVAPEQIEVKYILEVDKGKFNIPSKNRNKDYDKIKAYHKKHGFFDSKTKLKDFVFDTKAKSDLSVDDSVAIALDNLSKLNKDSDLSV